MQNRPSNVKISFGGPLSPVVRIFIWINVLVFLFSTLSGDRIFLEGYTYKQVLTEFLGLSPAYVLKDYALWQLATYLFVHVDFFHLLFNMLALWWFGSEVESLWGSKRFLHYFFFTGIGAGLVSVLFGVPTIGASGAVFGLLLAYGLSYPDRTLYLYFVFPVKAKYCVAVFGFIEFIALMTAGSGSRINHGAHLAGLAFGLVWFFFPKRMVSLPSLWKKYQKQKVRNRLRVIHTENPTPLKKEPYSKPTIH